jgi:hypothetical protein
MGRSKKKRLVEEAVIGAATGGVTPGLVSRLLPRRWHVGTLLTVIGVLLALGVLKFNWMGAGPGVRIDLDRSAQIERQAERLLKAAKDSLQQNR